MQKQCLVKNHIKMQKVQISEKLTCNHKLMQMAKLPKQHKFMSATMTENRQQIHTWEYQHHAAIKY